MPLVVREAVVRIIWSRRPVELGNRELLRFPIEITYEVADGVEILPPSRSSSPPLPVWPAPGLPFPPRQSRRHTLPQPQPSFAAGVALPLQPPIPPNRPGAQDYKRGGRLTEEELELERQRRREETRRLRELAMAAKDENAVTTVYMPAGRHAACCVVDQPGAAKDTWYDPLFFLSCSKDQGKLERYEDFSLTLFGNLRASCDRHK